MRYESAADVQMKIGSSLIHYKKRPVWCTYDPDDDRDKRVKLQDLQSGDVVRVDAEDPELDARAFCLGYFNKDTEAIYALRVPVRRSKQGLSSENCQYWEAARERFQTVQKATITSKPFVDMVVGSYRPVNEVLEMMKGNVFKSIAVGRKFAVVKDEIGLLKLHYFNTPVAFLGVGKKFMIPERFKHYVPFVQGLGIKPEIIDA